MIGGFDVIGEILTRDPRQALRDITTGLSDRLKALIFIALAPESIVICRDRSFAYVN